MKSKISEIFKSNVRDFAKDKDTGTFIDTSEFTIIVGDIDEDGKQDAILNYGFIPKDGSHHIYERIKIFLNKGNGTFKIINSNIQYCSDPQYIKNGTIFIYELDSCIFPKPIKENQYRFINGKLVRVHSKKIIINQ